ncbi:dihydrofolate reductase isoform X5 [Heterocephalus glaber]|nr:dihydrofolate reductase isoform X5 [Heterocephalus glaber]
MTTTSSVEGNAVPTGLGKAAVQERVSREVSRAPLGSFLSPRSGRSSRGKQNLVIMGRKTWFSIPEKNRPLKDRINIVLSRELKEPPRGAHFLAQSLDDALKLIEQPELASKVDMVWIVGGSSVYKEVMDRPGHVKLFVTRIMQEFESDTFFPEIDLKKYRLLPKYPGVLSEVQEEKGVTYKFEVYEKND